MVVILSEQFRWAPLACWQPLRRGVFRYADTPQCKVKGCAASKRLNSKRVKHLLIQRHHFTRKPLNAACQGKSSGLYFDLQRRRKKISLCVFVIFIERSFCTPSATRLQIQENQTHLFSPEKRSSHTAAFNTLLVKCTHRVALFRYKLNNNALGNCYDTVVTCNIHICLKSCWQT